jgi:DNA-binding MarR family transcriptional regulator
MENRMPFKLDEFLPYRLSVAAAKVSDRFAARYGAEAGLTIPEWRVLAHLHHSGAVSVRDIHTRVNLDKPMVSRAASQLQDKGWVKKSGNEVDRRLIVLELTPGGLELMARLSKIAEDFQAELLAELGECANTFTPALAILSSTPDAKS